MDVRNGVVSRRAVLSGTIGFATAVALGSGASLARQDAGEITLYSGRNEDLIGPLLEQAEAATGLTINARYGNTAEMAAAILEEGQNSPADVYLAQDGGALGAIQQAGRFQPLPDDVLEIVDTRYRSDQGGWVGLSGRVRCAVFNTEMVDAAAMPASIKDFTNEAWRGKIGWAPTNGSFQAFVTAFRVLEGDDAARAWLEGMAANDPVTFEGNAPIVRAVIDGELPVGLVNHYYLYNIAKEFTDPVSAENHFFDGGDVGSLVNIAGVGIIDSAPNPEGGLELIRYLLSEEAQQYFATQTSEYPLNPAVPPIPELMPLDEIESPDIDLNSLEDLQGTLELLTEVGLL